MILEEKMMVTFEEALSLSAGGYMLPVGDRYHEKNKWDPTCRDTQLWT